MNLEERRGEKGSARRHLGSLRAGAPGQQVTAGGGTRTLSCRGLGREITLANLQWMFSQP